MPRRRAIIRAGSERLASAGLPDSCVEVRVVDDDGRQLPLGEVGEIIVHGRHGDVGLLEQSGGARRSRCDDGWLWTGDVGAFDADGFLTLKDRSKDMIISGGSNIYPREVEEVLLMHPARRRVLGGRPPASASGAR